MTTTGWIPVTEAAEGWYFKNLDPQWPLSRARRVDGFIEVNADVQRFDGRDPIEGERAVRVPDAVLGPDWKRATWLVEVIGEGMRWVEVHEIDADGWYLVPRIVEPKRLVTPADHARLDEVSP